MTTLPTSFVATTFRFRALSPIPLCVRFVVAIWTATVSGLRAKFVWCAKTWHEGDQRRVPERVSLVVACHMTTPPFDLGCCGLTGSARAKVESAPAERTAESHPGSPDAEGSTYQTGLAACAAVPPWPRPRARRYTKSLLVRLATFEPCRQRIPDTKLISALVDAEITASVRGSVAGPAIRGLTTFCGSWTGCSMPGS
jgi:hypothetical protein